MTYLVHLIEHKKRTFLREFKNYATAAEYCEQGKETDPSVWFLISTMSSQGFKGHPRRKECFSAAPTPRSTTYCECHGVYQDCGYQDSCR